MSYIEPEDNLVDFPEKFLNLRDELDFTHGEDVSLFYITPNFKNNKKFFFYSSGMAT